MKQRAECPTFKEYRGSVYCPNGYKGESGAQGVYGSGLSGIGLNILQINLHHCSEANNVMVDYANNHNIDCIICQDPYILRSSICICEALLFGRYLL